MQDNYVDLKFLKDKSVEIRANKEERFSISNQIFSEIAQNVDKFLDDYKHRINDLILTENHDVKDAFSGWASTVARRLNTSYEKAGDDDQEMQGFEVRFPDLIKKAFQDELTERFLKRLCLLHGNHYKFHKSILNLVEAQKQLISLSRACKQYLLGEEILKTDLEKTLQIDRSKISSEEERPERIEVLRAFKEQNGENYYEFADLFYDFFPSELSRFAGDIADDITTIPEEFLGDAQIDSFLKERLNKLVTKDFEYLDFDSLPNITKNPLEKAGISRNSWNQFTPFVQSGVLEVISYAQIFGEAVDVQRFIKFVCEIGFFQEINRLKNESYLGFHEHEVSNGQKENLIILRAEYFPQAASVFGFFGLEGSHYEYLVHPVVDAVLLQLMFLDQDALSEEDKAQVSEEITEIVLRFTVSDQIRSCLERNDLLGLFNLSDRHDSKWFHKSLREIAEQVDKIDLLDLLYLDQNCLDAKSKIERVIGGSDLKSKEDYTFLRKDPSAQLFSPFEKVVNDLHEKCLKKLHKRDHFHQHDYYLMATFLDRLIEKEDDPKVKFIFKKMIVSKKVVGVTKVLKAATLSMAEWIEEDYQRNSYIGAIIYHKLTMDRIGDSRNLTGVLRRQGKSFPKLSDMDVENPERPVIENIDNSFLENFNHEEFGDASNQDADNLVLRLQAQLTQCVVSQFDDGLSQEEYFNQVDLFLFRMLYVAMQAMDSKEAKLMKVILQRSEDSGFVKELEKCFPRFAKIMREIMLPDEVIDDLFNDWEEIGVDNNRYSF